MSVSNREGTYQEAYMVYVLSSEGIFKCWMWNTSLGGSDSPLRITPIKILYVKGLVVQDQCKHDVVTNILQIVKPRIDYKNQRGKMITCDHS